MAFAAMLLPGMFKFKPDRETWKPVANCSEWYEKEAYQLAANKIGVDIKFGYPVPCPYGADGCAGLGMTGVYIRRAHAEKQGQLSSERFTQQFALTS